MALLITKDCCDERFTSQIRLHAGIVKNQFEKRTTARPATSVRYGKMPASRCHIVSSQIEIIEHVLWELPLSWT